MIMFEYLLNYIIRWNRRTEHIHMREYDWLNKWMNETDMSLLYPSTCHIWNSFNTCLVLTQFFVISCFSTQNPPMVLHTPTYMSQHPHVYIDRSSSHWRRLPWEGVESAMAVTHTVANYSPLVPLKFAYFSI